jgi:hypothetical protein
MIGLRGYRNAEPPRTSSRPAPSPLSSGHLARRRAEPLLRARAPPASTITPEMMLGQRRHPPAQPNQAPPETDYGTQPNTERSYGMTTKATSAGAQCKRSAGPSSCGVADARRAERSIKGGEP